MPDTKAYTFRTAISGFNKQDVARYIKKTAKAHEEEVQELQRQLEESSTEIEQLRARVQELEQAEESRLVASEEQADFEQYDSETVTQEPTESPEDTLMNRELLAYRRAEAVERVAHGRARQLYAQMQELCDRSAQQTEDSQNAAQAALEIIAEQLQLLQNASAVCHSSLSETSRELRAMEQTIPDPLESLEVE